GTPAALCAALLLAFESNVLAHGSLATTDLGAAFFTTLCAAAFCEHLAAPRRATLLAVGLTAGAAAASKASGLGVLPAIGLVLAWRGGTRSVAKTARELAAISATAAAVVVAVYGRGLWRFAEMLAYRSRQMSDPTPIYFFGGIH